MMDENTPTDPGHGHVNQIRRQWAVHEDEALAYRLQNEEITQHYSANRFRNATVREDLPRAREEQYREEQEALEERFRHLKLLQKQDEEDARVAKLFAGTVEDELLLGAAAADAGAHVEDLDFDILDKLDGNQAEGFDCNEINFEELKRIHEEQDEKLARTLQEQLEQIERDKRLEIETQDRELAKMIYMREKAKIKRAKERAKLKAAEATAVSSSDPGTAQRSDSGTGTTASQNCHKQSPSPEKYRENTRATPPKIPEKSRSFEPDDPISFRAIPKSLPPSPQKYSSNSTSPSPFQRDPVPPYMPMQGLKIQNKRK